MHGSKDCTTPTMRVAQERDYKLKQVEHREAPSNQVPGCPSQ
jgi:hypothetical protein